MLIENKRYFRKQVLLITEEGINIYKTGMFDSSEFMILYDQLDNKRSIKSSIDNNFLATGFVFFVFSLFFIFMFDSELGIVSICIAIILTVAAFLNRKSTVTIAGSYGTGIELFYNRSNREEVILMADEIIAATNQFYRRKFANIDRALPIEPQIDNIQFLRDKQIISESEYQNLKDTLLGRIASSSIGFSKQ